jgi:hypothetical protein
MRLPLGAVRRGYFHCETRRRRSAACIRAAAKRRQRRLLFEQFEDRRVLATAVDDDYYTEIDTQVSGSPLTENDEYNVSWPDQYCSTNLE